MVREQNTGCQPDEAYLKNTKESSESLKEALKITGDIFTNLVVDRDILVILNDRDYKNG